MVALIKQEEIWYVAIFKGFGVYCSYTACDSKHYHNLKDFKISRGIIPVAEIFDISGEVINKITGFDENGQKTENLPLKSITDRLNAGEKFDVQKALETICK